MDMRMFLFFILQIFSLNVFAQSSVSGHVQNKMGDPLEGCTVILLQSDSIIGGTITDCKGNFKIENLKEGSYVCRISMTGCKSIDHPFAVNHKVRLPNFIMEENEMTLKEVQVIGDKRDIVKYRAGSTMFLLSEHAKKSKSAFEALQEIPLLRVNASTRSISLTDGSTPLILINGIKRPNYIQQLDPELIESVEVIDNPSARYRGDESVASILNIKIKRAEKPYINGNAYAQHSPFKQNGVFGQGIEVGKPAASMYLNMMQFYFDKDHIESTSKCKIKNKL